MVEFQIGEEYYWSAADATVVPISIYENGVYVAGADISKETKELMTSILDVSALEAGYDGSSSRGREQP